jgi:hypothetical protein
VVSGVALVGFLHVDRAVAVGVSEGEHRRYPLHPAQLLVVQGHPGLTDLVVGLLSIRGTQPDRDRDLAVGRQEHQGDTRARGTTSIIRAPGQTSTSVRSTHPSTSV